MRHTFWFLISFLAACSAPARAPELPALAERTLLVDGHFSPDDASALRAAGLALEEGTDGRVRTGEGPTIDLVQVHDDEPIVQDADLRFHATVYGWYDGTGRIYFVSERHRTSRALQHTAMHELLHTVGAHHTGGDAHAIMAPSGDAHEEPLVLTLTDRREIARALRCEDF